MAVAGLGAVLVNTDPERRWGSHGVFYVVLSFKPLASVLLDVPVFMLLLAGQHGP